MGTIYFAETADGIRFPMHRTTTGGIAVIWFKEQSRAEAYIAESEKTGEWRIGSRTDDEAIDWLEHARSEGVTELVIDPPAGFDRSDVGYVPIDQVILSLNMSCRKQDP